jgi:hypothetical protein
VSIRQPNERLARLRAEHDRINAELQAVEDGTLPWMERHPLCFTAQIFADAFGLSITAANNRLTKLVRVGLLHREPVSAKGRGGRKFTYRAVNHDDKKPLVLTGEAGERAAHALRERGLAV